MERAVDTNNPPSYGIADKTGVISHRGIPEEITMNRHQLELELYKLKTGSKTPTYSEAWPWIVTAIAFLLTLSTAAEYRNTLGVPDLSP